MNAEFEVALWNGLINCFDLEELDQLAFSLGIKRDEITGDTRASRAQSLVEYCARRGQLHNLLTCCKQERPNYDWPQIHSPSEIAWLHILTSGWGVGPHPVRIHKPKFTLGRAPDSDLMIRPPSGIDAYVSRKHAIIERRSVGFIIYDTSANGTFVNTLQVDKAEGMPLRAGDRITLGSPEVSDQVFGVLFTIEPLLETPKRVQ